MSIKVPITVWSEVQSLQSHQVCTGFTSVQSCPYMAKLDPMSGPPRFDHIHPEPDRIQLCDAQHKLCHVISNVTTLKFLAPPWIWRINPSSGEGKFVLQPYIYSYRGADHGGTHFAWAHTQATAQDHHWRSPGEPPNWDALSCSWGPLQPACHKITTNFISSDKIVISVSIGVKWS